MNKRIDNERFERDVLRQVDAGLNLAKWLGLKHHDAEDAVQSAAIKAYEAFSQFRGQHPKAWFLAIVRNECIGIFRMKSRLRDIEVELDAEMEPRVGSTKPQVLTMDSDLLLSAIDLLPPLHKEALLLREVEDLSYQQIAEVTGVPIGTVMSRLNRARAALKSALEAEL